MRVGHSCPTTAVSRIHNGNAHPLQKTQRMAPPARMSETACFNFRQLGAGPAVKRPYLRLPHLSRFSKGGYHGPDITAYKIYLDKS